MTSEHERNHLNIIIPYQNLMQEKINHIKHGGNGKLLHEEEHMNTIRCLCQ